MCATDGRTRATLIAPFPTGGSIKSESGGIRKVDMHIIFENVLLLFTEKNIKISPRLSKLQLAKVGAFLRHSVDT